MTERSDKGWLQLNMQPLQHYWYTIPNGGLYHSLCGRLVVPTTIVQRAGVAPCLACEKIRMYERIMEEQDQDPKPE